MSEHSETTTKVSGKSPYELVPRVDQGAPVTPATPDTVANLIELFYDLFPDASPLGNRDFAYFGTLARDFGESLDISEELKRFHAWSLDKAPGQVKYPRSRFRDWLRKTRQYRRYYPS